MHAIVKNTLYSTMLILVSLRAGADSITISGKTHTGVIVREGQSLYYVQQPEEGTVMTVPKGEVAPEGVQISPDPAEREALLTRWKKVRNQRQGIMENNNLSPTPSIPAAESPASQNADPQKTASKTLRLSGEASTTQDPSLSSGLVPHGTIPYIKLNDVRLGDALKAILRSLNLDYRVQDNVIFISSPERLRMETWEALETRVYQLNGAADTLPRVVLSNPARGSGASSGYGASRYGGGYSQPSYGGYGGNYGGGYQGTTGYGGNQGGYRGGSYGGADVTALGNISELFSTIDDRIVGEPTARIGVN